MLPQPHCCPHAGKSSLGNASIAQFHGFSSLCSKPSHIHLPKTALLATPAIDAAAALLQPAGRLIQPAQVQARDMEAAPTAPQGSKYLTYQEYVAQQQEMRQPQASSSAVGQRADETAHASTSAPNQEGSGKRVPWNKGRKHSAMTIERIRAGAVLAAQRPEVKAKMQAWNKSRTGSKVPDDIKAKIAEKQRATMERKRQSMTAEELEAYRAKRSALAKRLWQDPEYAAKTMTAIHAANRRRKSESWKAGEGLKSSGSTGGSSSSSSSSSRAGARRSSRHKAAAADDAAAAAPDGKQPAAKKARAPSQKELATWAKEQQQFQQQQLQQQLDRMLQTQRLIATTEQTVQQLHGNMAAFENNPQAQATAAAALQQAQSHLEPARQLVSRLQASLDKHGVRWDPSTGQVTHINHQLLQERAAVKARGSRSTAAADRRQQPRSSSSSSRQAPSCRSSIAPDVVRNSPSGARLVQDSSGADGLVVSSRRRGAAAAAAAGGGSRGRASPGTVWTPVGVTAVEADGAVPAYTNGHHSMQNGNGNSNGNGRHGSSTYVPLGFSQTGRSSTSVGDGEEDEL